MTAIVYKSITMLLTDVCGNEDRAANLNHLYFYQFYSNVLTAFQSLLLLTALSNTESQTNV